MLIGVGPHARQFYLPAIQSLSSRYGVRLCATVEVLGTEESVQTSLSRNRLDPEMLFVPSFSAAMPEDVKRLLGAAIERLGIGSVIIATDPLSHGAYAIWAVGHGLHILLDKPITSRRDAVSDAAEAEGIEDDYRAIANAYRNLLARERKAFTICAHRRYHPGIQVALDRIADVSAQTGCPVTAIHGYHSDGQWRFPNEMVSQDHHSYHQGHGKASHSGHHFFDCVYRFYRAGLVENKQADALRIYASFVQPHGHLMQLTHEDYLRLFGKEYAEVCARNDEQLLPLLSKYGELDIAATLTFVRHGIPVCLGSLELLHNGFSRRSWVKSAADLYKGNGRVKHEQHRIHVGPFLAVQIHSYQARDDHRMSNADDLVAGGNNHFEIVFFHNTGMLPGSAAIERVRLSDLDHFDDARLHIEVVKEGTVAEFFSCLAGETDPLSSRSNLLDHLVPVQILSGVYRSHVAEMNGSNPVVTVPLRWQ
jgi:predicted dehydrogenase